MNKITAFYKRTAKRSKGQALVLIAVAFVTLLIIVGLTTDVGFMFIRYGQLRRAVDAAALAGAAQLREGRWIDEISGAAEQTVRLNGVDSVTLEVQMCGVSGGEDLCEDPGDPPLKLIRVIGTAEAPVFFMRLLGIDAIPVSAQSVAQAASLDVVLVIDVSQSMAYDGEIEYGDDNYNDASLCNTFAGQDPDPGAGIYPCRPFYEVKQAAKNFAERILEVSVANPSLVDDVEADRLGIVTFATGWMVDDSVAGATTYHMQSLGGWTTYYADAEAAIDSLKLYEGYNCADYVDDKDHLGSCLYYADGVTATDYVSLGCMTVDTYGDDSTCPTTSIGAGLHTAAYLFSLDERPNSLRIVVLLTDGANNASLASSNDCGGSQNCTNDQIYARISGGDSFGYCPTGTGYEKCRDTDVNTRTIVNTGTYPKCPMWLNDPGTGSPPFPVPDCPTDYDADDFAMDVADFLACDPHNSKCEYGRTGQGVIVFTIGMGPNFIGQTDDNGKPYGVWLLRYIANVGDDGDPDTDPCAGLYDNDTEYKEQCGNFYFVEDPDNLSDAFEAIASRIFTRISQ
ncbi:MAG: hypothetical protein JXB38_00490 [Anaerolineales bacterium]|nr:hypothetical protein [Anaerolineales bacterium]